MANKYLSYHHEINQEKNQYLQLELSYQLGGVNWANGDDEARGLYLHIQAVEKDGVFVKYGLMHDITGQGILSRKILIKVLKRKSSKQGEAIADRLDVEAIADLWLAGQHSEAYQLAQKAA